MRYTVLAVGALKRGFYRDGAAFYLKRLSAYAKVEVRELREGRGGDVENIKAQESEALLGSAQGYLIGLDERGEMLASVVLAERITALETRGVSGVSVLIGGAAGHSEALKERVDASWSLSKLTLPHELARLVLLESLYRAETIRAGHPYHRE